MKEALLVSKVLCAARFCLSAVRQAVTSFADTGERFHVTRISQLTANFGRAQTYAGRHSYAWQQHKNGTYCLSFDFGTEQESIASRDRALSIETNSLQCL